jgi:protease I
MKKVAVLVEERYQVLEVWYPYLRLRENGIKTVFVGPGRQKTYLSKEGYPVEEELAIKEAKTENFDAVVVPGGYIPDMIRNDERINRFVEEMSDAGKLVAAICHAGSVLVSAGILNGKTATCFYTVKDDVINAGANYVDKEVVVDGNLITSRNPNDLPAFCTEIVNYLRSA